MIAPNMPPLAGLYFGEDQGRYLVTAQDMSEIAERAKAIGIAAVPVGQTGGDACIFKRQDDASESTVTLTALREAATAFSATGWRLERGLPQASLPGAAHAERCRATGPG